MRASTAYFVGAGSIVAAIAIGLGGGIVAGNIMHPIAPKQGPDTGKMAQRAEPPAATAITTNAPSQRLQYITSSQTFGGIIAAPVPAQDEAKPDVKPDAPATQANAEPLAPPPPQTTAAVEPPKPAPASPPLITKPADQQASTQPASSPDNANAKARDADVKRATSDRRRTERRERWAERRHDDARDARSMRDQTNWNDVARNVREDSDARDGGSRPRSGFRLFGNGDD